MLSRTGSTERRSRAGGAAGRPSAGGRLLTGIVVALVLAAGAAVGLTRLERRVLGGGVVRGPVKLEINIEAPPAWMPAELARQIACELLPRGAQYYDRSLTDAVRGLAEAHPLVRQVVRVEKHTTGDPLVAAVDVQAVFRMPVAKVRAETAPAYVDAEGCRLPACQVPLWADAMADDGQVRYYLDRNSAPPAARLSAVHYITIEGVSGPVPAVGGRWPGEDMAAGLALVALVAGRPYAYQITAVDVGNFGGRRDPAQPHLCMWAQSGRLRPTCIRFGRLPNPGGDHIVSPQRKLSYLDRYAADHDGQLAGLCQYIDLRYDQLHVSIN